MALQDALIVTGVVQLGVLDHQAVVAVVLHDLILVSSCAFLYKCIFNCHLNRDFINFSITCFSKNHFAILLLTVNLAVKLTLSAEP